MSGSSAPCPRSPKWNRRRSSAVEPNMTSTDRASTDAVRVLDAPDPSLYATLLHDAHVTHASPVWLGGSRLGFLPVPKDPSAAIDALDPYSVLAGWWPGPCPDGCLCLEPFTGALPELARAGSHDRSQEAATAHEALTFAREIAMHKSLALVDVVRPADIPAAVGWGGICNYSHQDLVRICAVLRSWEERFGAILTVMTESVLQLSVADPPRSREESEQVATEHFSFCPDQHDPQNGTVYTPRTYGTRIRGKRRWTFWWD